MGTNNNGKPKISVNNFNFYYGDFQSLRDITIDLPANKITSIIGPSGCGKSTFIRSFNRMNDLIPSVHSTGKIIIDEDGCIIWIWNPELIKRLEKQDIIIK